MARKAAAVEDFVVMVEDMQKEKRIQVPPGTIESRIYQFPDDTHEIHGTSVDINTRRFTFDKSPFQMSLCRGAVNGFENECATLSNRLRFPIRKVVVNIGKVVKQQF